MLRSRTGGDLLAKVAKVASPAKRGWPFTGDNLKSMLAKAVNSNGHKRPKGHGNTDGVALDTYTPGIYYRGVRFCEIHRTLRGIAALRA